MGNRENKRRKNDWLIGGSYAGKETVIKSGAEEKFHASRGHGFAAERANNLHDNMTGKNAEVVGDDNKTNGADRIVNGVKIQSKYCASGSKCIRECFGTNGEFRYYVKKSDGNFVKNPDGTRKVMQIEVPSDKYDDAVKAMQDRIDQGRGPEGVKDAREIVRKGNITYDQAKNIANAGTIDSLIYDAVDGIRIGAYSGGISAAVTFAVATWNGKSFDEALEQSVAAGLQTGGLAWASTILVGQMTKAGVNSLLVNSSEAVVKMLGNKATSTLANFLRSEAIKNGSKEISGAAATKYMSKFLRGNVITGIATVVVMSTGDVVNIFRGRISFGQLFKNVVNTSANVGGGVVGWKAGAAAGSFFGPVGTFLGGLTGAVVGSTVAGKASQTVTDGLIEDDAKAMLRILEDEFKTVAVDFLLNKTESEKVADALKEKLNGGSKLKDMYASDDCREFARKLIESCTVPVIKRRKKISLPSTQDYVRGLRKVLEKSADGGTDYSPTKYVCSICGYVYEGDPSPIQCPICKAHADKFVEQ